jgi:NADH-quinone oxidoreductase subunit N
MSSVVLAAVKTPEIDWALLSPLIALVGGSIVALMAGLLPGRAIQRHGVPFIALLGLGASIGLSVWQWDENALILEGALRMDDLALALNVLFCISAAMAVLLSWRSSAPAVAGHGEYYALILASVAGMLVLAAGENLVSIFLGFELLSIPLYVLCATELRRSASLESGLKYLVLGSVGSATLLYGLALIYGATGSTDLAPVSRELTGSLVNDPLMLTGIALVLVGFAFKASVAPFHQWTPDVYEGAPTPITAFMATATKAAAFGAIIRVMELGLGPASADWAPALAALAAITIVVGNVGAIGQRSVKRILAWSSVAQAGYILAGVVVATRAGVEATLIYLAVYLVMNMAAFAVVVARERETGEGDDLRALEGLGAQRPWLAGAMTVAMLSLAGFPLTAGFVGKFTLIAASVDGDYAWLGVMIVIGSMISLVYYLRIIAAVWMRPAPEAGAAVATRPLPAMAGGAPEADERGAGTTPGIDREAPDFDEAAMAEASFTRVPLQWEVAFVALVSAAASIAFGIVPGPLFDAAADAAGSLARVAGL